MTNDDAAKMVRELLDYDGDRVMNPWELEFVEDMANQGSFSQKQAIKIEQIWQKILG